MKVEEAVGRRVLLVAAVATLGLLGVTCAENRSSFYVIEMQAPAAAPDCSYPSTTGVAYLTTGTLDLGLFSAVTPARYWGAPLLFNNLIQTRNAIGLIHPDP